MKRYATCIAAMTAAVFINATDATAQRNHQSDVAGVVVSGSDVTGGAFAALPPAAPAVAFATPAAVVQVAAAIGQATVAVQAAATTAAATTAAAPAPGAPAGTAAPTPAAVAAQTVLAAVLTCSGSCGGAPEVLTTALQGTTVSAAMQTSAEALTTALKGLAQAGTADAPALALRINDARTAFVKMIDSASEAYLLNPPAELVAVHTLLVNVLEAASAK